MCGVCLTISWIALLYEIVDTANCHCGVEEDKGTASAVPDTNDSAGCVLDRNRSQRICFSKFAGVRCDLSPLPF